MAIERAILDGDGDVQAGRYLPPTADDPRRRPHGEARDHLRHRLAEGLYA